MRRTGAALVTAGTFGAPAAQWMVFWLVARTEGSSSAGQFALLLAISTPVFVVASFGLRNAYITLSERYSFRSYFLLRSVGAVLGAVVVLLFGAIAHADMALCLLVIVLKVADAILDILYARMQRERRLTMFGVTMLVNGIATISLAILVAALGGSAAAIVGASAAGSLAALLVGATPYIGLISPSNRRAIGSPLVRELRGILASSWPVVGGQVLASLVVYVPTWVVAYAGDVDDVGRFSAAAYMLTAGSLLGSALSSVHIGEYQALLRTGGAQEVMRRSIRATWTVTLLGLAATGVVAVVGVQLFEFVYGSQFVFTSLELAVIALAAALGPGTHLLNASLLVLNRYRLQMVIVAWAVAASAAVAILGLACGSDPLVIGGGAALIGSVIKFVLSIRAIRGRGAAE